MGPVLRTLFAALAICSALTAQSPDPPEILWQESVQTTYYSLGYSVAWLGDVTGDEIDDYAASAPGIGAVRIYSGDTKTQIASVSGNLRHGHSLTSLGDVNGDGIPDFAAGTPFVNSNSGEVRVYSGADFTVIYTLSGAQPGDYLGWGLASIGDTDGDGVPDMLVRSYRDQGRVRLHSGIDGALRFEIAPTAGFEYAGEGLAGIHDFNGDGAADFLVGAPGRGSGQVVLHSGADGAVLSTKQPPRSREFGTSICQLGDVNRDQVPDFAVGAPATSGLGTHVGDVRVYCGQTLNQIRFKLGNEQSDRFGALVASGGDYNRDGVADLLVAAPGADANFLNSAGVVQLLSGADLAVLASTGGTQQFERMPSSLAGYGDAHHDLHPDYLIGNSNFGSSENGIVRMWGAPSPWLRVSALLAGQPATLSASECDGGSTVTFWASLTGGGPSLTPLGWVLLNPPFRELGSATAPPHGVAEWTEVVPAGMTGIRVYFQAAEARSGLSTRLTTATSKLVH